MVVRGRRAKRGEARRVGRGDAWRGVRGDARGKGDRPARAEGQGRPRLASAVGDVRRRRGFDAGPRCLEDTDAAVADDRRAGPKARFVAQAGGLDLG